MDVSGMRGRLKVCDHEDVTSAVDLITGKIVARHGWRGEFGEFYIHFIVSLVVPADTEILMSHNLGCGLIWHTKWSARLQLRSLKWACSMLYCRLKLITHILTSLHVCQKTPQSNQLL